MMFSKQKQEKYRLKPQKVTVGVQQYQMMLKFPEFRFYKNGCLAFGWIGKLKPTEVSPFYTVKIEYHHRHPKVYILEPMILEKAPHRYGDGHLCLYYPKDKSYNEASVIADSIVPWTALWLYYYEIWLKEGVWWGPEAPHLPTSKEGQRINRHY